MRVDLVIEEHVGWGPGAKVLGSTHTGLPIDGSDYPDRPRDKRVKIEAWADIGTGAVVLPGVTIGRGSIIGAARSLLKDVPPFAVVAGVPARLLRGRPDTSEKASRNER